MTGPKHREIKGGEGQLIVVSNRTAADPSARAGGLAVAMWDSLTARGGCWVGWSGRLRDYPSPKPQIQREGNVEFALVDLRKSDYDNYYLGFANEALWPLMHSRLDLAKFDRSTFAAYRHVNEQFADVVAERSTPDDFIWVQDYHFFLLARGLRSRGVTAKIGFFLHIPFPPPDIFRALPQNADILDGLIAYDVIGLQTEEDVKSLRRLLVDDRSGVILDAERVLVGDREVRLRHCPIGIDVDSFRSERHSDGAVEAVDKLSRFLGGRKLILGVDRMDYSKGIPQRFEAVAKLFDDHRDLHGKVSFTQIAPPSRSRAEEYKKLRRRIDRLSGRINGNYADLDWIPIRYLARGYQRAELAGIYELANVCLVTPLQDGMNLVAKEFVAAQDEADPGVLILSQFAGSAAQMPDALLVNPHDTDGVAAAIRTALDMPLAERQYRWRKLYRGIRDEDINWWRRRYFEGL